MKRSEIRGDRLTIAPDFAALHPGYIRVMRISVIFAYAP